MPYFSRLTDIVTCNLTAILEGADDPAAALDEIVREMDQGLVASRRSVKTATANVEAIERDIERQQTDLTHWQAEAKRSLQGGDEAAAKSALMRKKETQSLIDGLQQSLAAAHATRDQLTTTYRALHARMADARRRQAELSGEAATPLAAPDELASEIDAELEALRAEL